MVHEFAVFGLLLPVLLVFPLFGCTGYDEIEESQETYKIEACTKLSVHNRNGSIRVTGWDEDYVEVHVVKRTDKGKAELEKVRIQISTDGETVIRTEYSDWTAKVSVRLRISVPAFVLVNRIENSNGKIELEGIKGDVIASTSNGGIGITSVDGCVTAHTSNGSIDIQGATGVLRAETSNGSIKAGVLSVRDEDVVIGTSNGSVELYVSSDLNADIDMRTSNGKVSIHDIEMTIIESSPNYISGKIGDGGSCIRAITSNGSVNLYKL